MIFTPSLLRDDATTQSFVLKAFGRLRNERLQRQRLWSAEFHPIKTGAELPGYRTRRRLGARRGEIALVTPVHISTLYQRSAVGLYQEKVG